MSTTTYATIHIDADDDTADVTINDQTRTERIDWDRTLTQRQLDEGPDVDDSGFIVQLGLTDGTTWISHGGDDWRSL